MMTLRRIPFAKMHALGNDFLIVERHAVEGCEPGALASRMCDRHTGLGADGLVLLNPSSRAPAAGFRIYNSDGSEAALSGNALRCAAVWLAAHAPKPPARIRLETRVGPRDVFYLGRDAADWIFRTEIGTPSFAPAEVPYRPPQSRASPQPGVDCALPVGDVTFRATILSMGNPQCILFVDDWAARDWMALGAELERHPWFPDRVNVSFARVLDEEHLEARFWERGAGHTLASGTGSCACAVAAHLAGKCRRRVRVSLERGELEVWWREDNVVELTGPGTIVAEGVYLADG